MTASPSAVEAAGPARPTLATSFDPRNNSLNFLRLFFAVMVIVGHSFHLGYGRDVPHLGSLNFRDMAVDGFFVISGYLITRSRMNGRSGYDYLRSRFLRIFPGYWLALIVGAVVVGPIAWAHQHGSLSGYGSVDPSPIGYIGRNITLFVAQYNIGGVFTGAHVGGSVNGSLWTLLHEFLVYLLIAAVAAVGLLRMRSRIMLVIAAGYLVALLWITVNLPSFQAFVHSPQLLPDAVRLGFMFVVGAVLFLWSDKVPFSTPLAIVSALVLLATALLPQWKLVGAFPFAYLVMWLGIRLPFEKVGSRHDLSYGIYLYGWPSQQLLWMWGVPSIGFVAYTGAAIAMAAAMAFVSWNLVESKALSLKRKRKSKEEVAVSVPGAVVAPEARSG